MHVHKKDIKVKISLGRKLIDTLTLLDPSKEVIVPLSQKISEDKIVIACHTTVALADGTFSLGSVSIPQQIIYNGGLDTYTQWITLFEHDDDDEYDGEMGIDDDEDPRISVRFVTAKDEQLVTKEPLAKPKQAFAASSNRNTETSYKNFDEVPITQQRQSSQKLYDDASAPTQQRRGSPKQYENEMPLTKQIRASPEFAKSSYSKPVQGKASTNSIKNKTDTLIPAQKSSPNDNKVKQINALNSNEKTPAQFSQKNIQIDIPYSTVSDIEQELAKNPNYAHDP